MTDHNTTPLPGVPMTAAVRVDVQQTTGDDRSAFEKAGGTSILPVLEPRGEGQQPEQNVLVLRISTGTPLQELAALLHIAAAGLDEHVAEAGGGSVTVKSIEVQS